MLEDAIHYFFHCRKFTIEMQGFNNTVRVFQRLSIDMILFGNYKWNMGNKSCLELFTDIYILSVFNNQLILCLKVFLKHTLYVNKYTYNQICSIPKLKDSRQLYYCFVVFILIQYLLFTFLFIYYSDVHFSIIYILSSFIYYYFYLFFASNIVLFMLLSV